MTKTIYCVRHGLAEHNVLYKKYGEQAHFFKDYIDTKLVSDGIEQAKKLGNKIINDNLDIELILVSPLQRTLETCHYMFPNTDIPIISLEEIREYPCGLHTCNKRGNISDIENIYTNIDFNLIKNNSDIIWNNNRYETIEELDMRIEQFKKFIRKRTENNIMVISHCSYLSHLMYNNFKGIKHCHIYNTVL